MNMYTLRIRGGISKLSIHRNRVIDLDIYEVGTENQKFARGSPSIDYGSMKMA